MSLQGRNDSSCKNIRKWALISNQKYSKATNDAQTNDYS